MGTQLHASINVLTLTAETNHFLCTVKRPDIYYLRTRRSKPSQCPDFYSSSQSSHLHWQMTTEGVMQTRRPKKITFFAQALSLEVISNSCLRPVGLRMVTQFLACSDSSMLEPEPEICPYQCFVSEHYLFAEFLRQKMSQCVIL